MLSKVAAALHRCHDQAPLTVSIAFDQVENRLHTFKAVLAATFG